MISALIADKLFALFESEVIKHEPDIQRLILGEVQQVLEKAISKERIKANEFSSHSTSIIQPEGIEK